MRAPWTHSTSTILAPSKRRHPSTTEEDLSDVVRSHRHRGRRRPPKTSRLQALQLAMHEQHSLQVAEAHACLRARQAESKLRQQLLMATSGWLEATPDMVLRALNNGSLLGHVVHPGGHATPTTSPPAAAHPASAPPPTLLPAPPTSLVTTTPPHIRAGHGKRATPTPVLLHAHGWPRRPGTFARRSSARAHIGPRLISSPAGRHSARPRSSPPTGSVPAAAPTGPVPSPPTRSQNRHSFSLARRRNPTILPTTAAAFRAPPTPFTTGPSASASPGPPIRTPSASSYAAYTTPSLVQSVSIRVLLECVRALPPFITPFCSVVRTVVYFKLHGSERLWAIDT